MPKQQELDEELDGLEDVTSTGEESTRNQPQPNRQSANWQDDPEYRRIQSEKDARAARAEKLAYEAQQEAARMRQYVEQMSLQGLEGEQLLARQLQLKEAELQRLKQERELDLYAIQRQRDLEDIVRKTGVPISEIEGSPNVHVAWQIGYDWKEKNGPVKPTEKTREQQIEEEADDTVDVGSSRNTSRASSYQQRYDEHRKAYNYKEALEVMADAERKGVAIKEW